MTTVILVTPLLDPSSSVRGFLAGHVRGLADEFERVVIVAGAVAADAAAPGAIAPGVEVVQGPDGDAHAIEFALAGALDDVEGRVVVVVQDDLRCLVQARAVTRESSVPLLWWCTQIPSTRAATEAARWADGLVVAAPPLAEVPGCRAWTVGAGVDVATSYPTLTPVPPRPPFRLLALGRTAAVKGLPVVLRAVAIARSHGLDARLRIVGPSTNASEWQHRAELEALVKNIALSSVVQIDDGVEPGEIPEILRQSHVLVDAGGDDDISISVLEAMAAGRAVVTASRRVAAILPDSQPTLTFDAGNAFELAERIVALDETWTTGLPRIGLALREVVERQHSLDRWQEQFATAVDEVRFDATDGLGNKGPGAEGSNGSGPGPAGVPGASITGPPPSAAAGHS